MRALQKARSKRQREEVDRLWTYTYSPPEYTCIYIYIELSLSRLFRQSGHLDIRGYLVAWPVRKIVQHGQSFRLRNGLDKPHS